MKQQLLLPALTAIGLIGLGGSHSTLAQEPTMEGEFIYVAEDSSDIGKAIESAVAKMNFIKRPIARGRLTKTNPAYRRIAISRTATNIQVTFDGRNPVRMPADGSVTKWKRDDGEQFDVSAEWQPPRLVQKYTAPDGERVNTFRLSPDGRDLTLDVVISSEQLPKPLKYSLTYRRAGS